MKWPLHRPAGEGAPPRQLRAPDFGFYVRYTPLTFRWRQSADTLLTLHSRCRESDG